MKAIYIWFSIHTFLLFSDYLNMYRAEKCFDLSVPKADNFLSNVTYVFL